MKQLELTLEIPVQGGSETDFSDLKALARAGGVARVSGLDGEHVLQLGVLVGMGGLRLLRTWLLARVERLKYTQVAWNDRIFRGYTADEVAVLISALEEHFGDNEPAAVEGPDGAKEINP